MIAQWLLRAPHLWALWSRLAVHFGPCNTLMRGRPWEDTQ